MVDSGSIIFCTKTPITIRVTKFDCDADVLGRVGTMYNATKGLDQQDMVENWASEVHPEAWGELVKVGQTTTRDGWKLFKIDRSLKA